MVPFKDLFGGVSQSCLGPVSLGLRSWVRNNVLGCPEGKPLTRFSDVPNPSLAVSPVGHLINPIPYAVVLAMMDT